MARIEVVAIGLLVLTGETTGSHVHVTVRGAGRDGDRPLAGQIVLTPREWESLADASCGNALAVPKEPSRG